MHLGPHVQLPPGQPCKAAAQQPRPRGARARLLSLIIRSPAPGTIPAVTPEVAGSSPVAPVAVSTCKSAETAFGDATQPA